MLESWRGLSCVTCLIDGSLLTWGSRGFGAGSQSILFVACGPDENNPIHKGIRQSESKVPQKSATPT